MFSDQPCINHTIIRKTVNRLIGGVQVGYNYGKPRPAAQSMSKFPAILLFLAVGLFIAADLLLNFDFNWVDYAIVIVIALFGLQGYVKGLINTVFSLGGYVLGIICAFVFSPKVALLAMQKTGLGKSIGGKINELLPGLSAIQNVKMSDANSTLDLLAKSPQFDQAVSANPILKQLLTITNSAADTSSGYQETVVTFNDLITYSLLKVLALVVIFVVVKLLVVLVGKLLTSVLNSSALLGTANRTAGLAIGLATGLLITYVVFILVIPFLSSLNIIKMADTYTQSIVLKWYKDLILFLTGSR